MARSAPDDRFARLIDASAEVFIRQGYRRTQMQDIADALGVAKGTLYACVESKAALFDAALTYADWLQPLPGAGNLPLPDIDHATLLENFRERISQATKGLELTAVLKRKDVRDPVTEFSSVIHDLYNRLSQNRKAIKILDRSSLDQPELAELWFEETRRVQLAALTRYLDRRIAQGGFRKLRNLEVFARAILETVVFWAVHRHWDPAPQKVVEEEIPSILVDMLLNGLTREHT